eukprot:490175-Pyramimonas_sp.AAC.1
MVQKHEVSGRWLRSKGQQVSASWTRQCNVARRTAGSGPPCPRGPALAQARRARDAIRVARQAPILPLSRAYEW